MTPLTNAELGLTDGRWQGKAPLWFYVLKEAELVHGGRRLGPVGGRIVAETILGLLELDAMRFRIDETGREVLAQRRIPHPLLGPPVPPDEAEVRRADPAAPARRDPDRLPVLLQLPLGRKTESGERRLGCDRTVRPLQSRLHELTEVQTAAGAPAPAA